MLTSLGAPTQCLRRIASEHEQLAWGGISHGASEALYRYAVIRTHDISAALHTLMPIVQSSTNSLALGVLSPTG